MKEAADALSDATSAAATARATLGSDLEAKITANTNGINDVKKECKDEDDKLKNELSGLITTGDESSATDLLSAVDSLTTNIKDGDSKVASDLQSAVDALTQNIIGSETSGASNLQSAVESLTGAIIAGDKKGEEDLKAGIEDAKECAKQDTAKVAKKVDDVEAGLGAMIGYNVREINEDIKDLEGAARKAREEINKRLSGHDHENEDIHSDISTMKDSLTDLEKKITATGDEASKQNSNLATTIDTGIQSLTDDLTNAINAASTANDELKTKLAGDISGAADKAALDNDALKTELDGKITTNANDISTAAMKVATDLKDVADAAQKANDELKTYVQGELTRVEKFSESSFNGIAGQLKEQKELATKQLVDTVSQSVDDLKKTMGENKDAASQAILAVATSTAMDLENAKTESAFARATLESNLEEKINDTSTGNFQAITENAELIDGLLKEANKKINANGAAITKAKEELSANLASELSHQKELLDAKISESGNAATEAAGMLQGNIEDAKKEAADAVAAAKKEATDAVAAAAGKAATDVAAAEQKAADALAVAKTESSDAVAAAKKDASDALATATAAAATARSTLGSDLEGKIDAAKKAV